MSGGAFERRTPTQRRFVVVVGDCRNGVEFARSHLDGRRSCRGSFSLTFCCCCCCRGMRVVDTGMLFIIVRRSRTRSWRSVSTVARACRAMTPKARGTSLSRFLFLFCFVLSVTATKFRCSCIENDLSPARATVHLKVPFFSLYYWGKKLQNISE